MSYCKNCGVELSHTESVCPLCQIRVESNALYSAYPAAVEKVPSGAKNASLFALLGIIPAIQIFFEKLVFMISEIKR